MTDAMGRTPPEDGFVPAPVTSVDDYKRGHIDDLGQPWIDGHRVTTTTFEAHRQEWCRFYEAEEAEGWRCDGHS
jgi:hypothetical protein